MLKECIEALEIDPEGTYVDVTFGGGGHSRKILENLKGGRLSPSIKTRMPNGSGKN